MSIEVRKREGKRERKRGERVREVEGREKERGGRGRRERKRMYNNEMSLALVQTIGSAGRSSRGGVTFYCYGLKVQIHVHYVRCQL